LGAEPLPAKAVVTGASSGIGAAIATALRSAGVDVVAVSRQPPPSAAHSPDGGAITGIAIDLADLDRLPERLAALTREHGDAGIVIACAGSGRFGSLEELSYEQIRSSISLNLIASVYLARAFVPLFKRRGNGDLVLMGSEAALAGGRRGAVYAAAKSGLRGLAQSLRAECAGRGVRVMLVNPGMTRTPFFDGQTFAPGDGADEHIRPEDVADAVVAALGMPRGTVVDEINLSPLKKVVRFPGSGGGSGR
jgi:short-subunit dehydrogenase